MDSQKFENFTKSLASGTSRRSLVRGIFGSIVGGALAMEGISRGAAKPAGKVGICHSTGSATNPFVYMEVSANALPAHEAHGDLVSCPGAGVLNTATCACDCDLTCEGNFVLDAGACACVCGLDPSTCPRDTIFNAETCSCDCTLTDDQCPNLEVADQGSCSCYCPVDDIVCPEGQVFDAETCACGAGPDPECAGATCTTFLPCDSENPDCVCTTLYGGGGFCVPGSTSCGVVGACEADGSCPDGSLCVVDSCCGYPVCVPVDLACSGGGAAMTNFSVPAGPTIGGR